MRGAGRGKRGGGGSETSRSGGGGGGGGKKHYHLNHQPIFPFGNSCARLHISMQVVQLPLYPPKRCFNVFILAASSP